VAGYHNPLGCPFIMPADPRHIASWGARTTSIFIWPRFARSVDPFKSFLHLERMQPRIFSNHGKRATDTSFEDDPISTPFLVVSLFFFTGPESLYLAGPVSNYCPRSDPNELGYPCLLPGRSFVHKFTIGA
jgi:hypothetical protein